MRGGWSGFGMVIVGINPTSFELHPTTIPPGGVVQNCLYKYVLVFWSPMFVAKYINMFWCFGPHPKGEGEISHTIGLHGDHNWPNMLFCIYVFF